MNLHAGSATELADLRHWLVDHPDDTDPAIRKVAADWLASIETAFPVDAYPVLTGVPHAIRDVIADVIADWCEVLSAQPEEEPFHTYIHGEAA